MLEGLGEIANLAFVKYGSRSSGLGRTSPNGQLTRTLREEPSLDLESTASFPYLPAVSAIRNLTPPTLVPGSRVGLLNPPKTMMHCFLNEIVAMMVFGPDCAMRRGRLLPSGCGWSSTGRYPVIFPLLSPRVDSISA